MMTSLQRLLRDRRAELLSAWLADVQPMWESHGPRGVDAHAVGSRLPALFDGILAVLEQPAGDHFDFDPKGQLAIHLRQIVADQARGGGDPTKAVGFVLTLKRILTRQLVDTLAVSSEGAAADLLWLAQVLDRLALFTFESFVEIREDIITQQSLSLLELSTPVLRLWHRILLLPLVGVIDTVRARQITERLLEAIARYEARVTILDLTGVPVLDTSVAQHLMKTIDAARLLGTRIVMTGISPEGAQTLTKLGIRFGDVISRATLRAGIAEALMLVGQRIGPAEDSRS